MEGETFLFYLLRKFLSCAKHTIPGALGVNSFFRSVKTDESKNRELWKNDTRVGSVFSLYKN